MGLALHAWTWLTTISKSWELRNENKITQRFTGHPLRRILQKREITGAPVPNVLHASMEGPIGVTISIPCVILLYIYDVLCDCTVLCILLPSSTFFFCSSLQSWSAMVKCPKMLFVRFCSIWKRNLLAYLFRSFLRASIKKSLFILGICIYYLICV